MGDRALSVVLGSIAVGVGLIVGGFVVFLTGSETAVKWWAIAFGLNSAVAICAALVLAWAWRAPKATEPTAPYAAYLASPEWQAKRRSALARAGHRCQLCNSARRLNVHHRTYDRLGNEAEADLTVLCRDCHRRFHGINGLS